MTKGDRRRIFWLRAAVALAPGVALPVAASGGLDPSLRHCIERLRDDDLDEQLLCLRKLREAGPDAAAATPTLADLLTRADGATDHVLIASVLDVLRSQGHDAAPAAETLSTLLPHRSKLYGNRDKMLVLRLRAYILVTLGEIGFPASALTALLEALANVDERMTALEVGAAARAVRSLGARGHEFAPYLLGTLTLRLSEEEFSLERYEPQFPEHEVTTVQLEAVRSLSRVCSPSDREVLRVLRHFAEDESLDVDPRVIREARRALDLILSAPTETNVSRRKDG